MKKQKRKKKIHFRKHKFWVQYTTKSTTCKYSHAKRFKHEPKGFCCSEEEISLVANNVPQELHELFTSDSKWAIEFKKYIRTYDNTFAFTTFGVKYVEEIKVYIHFKFKVKSVIFWMNYYHQIVTHHIYNFISMIQNMK